MSGDGAPSGAAGAAADDRPDAPALSLSDVRRTFGDVTVLDGVSLDVARGEVVAVVGPNGSGKTTLSRVAAGLLAPSGGRVSRPSAAPGGRAVAYLPQRPSFRATLTVRETLSFYASLAGDPGDDDALLARLDRVGLAGAADRRVEALSGGMTRLLGLAVAAVGDPALVVLDEPTGGLDPALSRRVFDRVAAQASADRGVLVASHDLASVATAADTVAVLDRGGFLAVGSPEEVCEAAGAGTLTDAFATLVDRGEAVARTGEGGAAAGPAAGGDGDDGGGDAGPEDPDGDVTPGTDPGTGGGGRTGGDGG